MKYLKLTLAIYDRELKIYKSGDPVLVNMATASYIDYWQHGEQKILQITWGDGNDNTNGTYVRVMGSMEELERKL